MDYMKKHFFRFTKWGWLTVSICLVSCLFVILLGIKVIQTKDLNLIIPYGIATLIYLGFFFYNMYLGISRIVTYPQKLKHYRNLTKVFEKKGYDPTTEYYLTTICDREVSKQLREDFNVKE